MKGKVIAIIVVVALVAVGFLFFGKKSGTAPSGTTKTVNNPNIPPLVGPSDKGTAPAPTGNIDDAVNAVLNDNNADTAPSAESNPALTQENDTAITDFGQAFSGTGL